MTIFAVYGITAGLLSFAAISTYIVEVIRGTTRPSRVTWWVLALLNACLTASYYASGARDTIWIPASYAVGFAIVAVLSLTKGEGSWSKWDTIPFIGAVISLFVWWRFQSAEAALYLIILTDFIGLAPTIFKTYRRPWTESKLAWGIATVASALNVAAVEHWYPAIYLYPLYVAVTNALIAGFIFFPYFREPVGETVA